MITRPKDNTFNKTLNDLKNQAYIAACHHGFHDKYHSDNHFLMLVITELAEAVEADRKGYYGDADKFIEAMNVYKEGDSPICFESHFNKYIKDSVADELADAVIRLLDLAGLRDVKVFLRNTIEDLLGASYKNIEFAQCVFGIVSNITMWSEYIDTCINSTLERIFALAKSRDIDLLWHINEKMKYNELRPNKHGKLY